MVYNICYIWCYITWYWKHSLHKAFWWIRVGINSQLSSISAFSTDLKRIQTPHRLFLVFWADKTSTTHCSGGRVQVWVQVWAPACQLAITPEGYSRRHSKVLTANQWRGILGQHSPRSCTAWAGRTGQQIQEVSKLATVAAGSNRLA